ncbi:prepilin-type N-terminal cleavage/methylation domain-containing protein [Patescibacteria group bacterium]|nr:prepilin-type N-terminal cleavage/methylation domain-containing protein [Patescibacteria group bacterium]MBU1895343.1 prepilin-type N-terminal cleavage/methylation domain-containing protein [Patescibacteria group bacterium]
MIYSKKGFSLLEILVALGIFVLFAVGIYSGIQSVFKSVYFSRVRIIETGVLNEQLEIIHNMTFEDIGITNGSPPGVLTRVVTTTRNNIDFTITRTIRFIDDPFDGIMGGIKPPEGEKTVLCHNDHTISVGNPAIQAHLDHGDYLGECIEGDEVIGGEVGEDFSAGDYKLVEIEIICDHCGQQKPVSITTYIAPKYLEGDPDHGAMLVEVLDSLAQPVQGAEVHIISTSTDPEYDFVDTTDNNGHLMIPDLASAMDAYQITVSKTGYITDGTNNLVANPVRPLVSVIAQAIQPAFFEIDLVASLEISTLNSVCQAVGSIPLRVFGTNKIGTDPDILRVDENIVTNVSGNYTLSNLRWDEYDFETSIYDIIGAIPILPVELLAGVSQPVQILIGPNSVNSLLVHVQDSNNAQPISQAIVRVSGGAYDETLSTGVGHLRQTDWSFGDGQEFFINPAKYWTSDENIDVVGSPGDIILSKVGNDYVFSGELESSVFDLETEVDFIDISWEPLGQPAETSVKLQIASSNTSTPESWDYLGPDGTVDTYYDIENVNVNDIHDNSRYFRYKVFLNTSTSSATPTFSDLSVSYITGCTPPGQAYFGGLSSTEYDVTISADGYQEFTSSVSASGDIFFVATMVTE